MTTPPTVPETPDELRAAADDLVADLVPSRVGDPSLTAGVERLARSYAAAELRAAAGTEVRCSAPWCSCPRPLNFAGPCADPWTPRG
jgi:hypothetical protein